MTDFDCTTGRVLVLGDNEFAALQVVRSLGRAGLACELTLHAARSITRHSRFVAACHDWGNPLIESGRFLTELLNQVKRVPYDLVIPTADETLLPVMQVADELRSHTRVAAPGPKAFDAAFYKDNTVALAQELGIPVPKTLVCRGESDLACAADWKAFPAVLKPASSVSLGTSSRKSVKVAYSRDQLDQWLPEMLHNGRVLVQEFCRGHGVGLCILAEHGRLVAAFQHRRVHEPPAGGASSYRKSEPLSAELLAHAERFCAATAWHGPAMFEYKQDPIDGRSTLMEVNGRFWGSLALSIKSGVDFPKLLYDLCVTGRVQETFAYRVPYFVRHTPRDVYWLQANLRAPRHRSDLIKLSTWQIVRELGNVLRLREGYDLESWSDPRPAVHAWWLTAKQIAGDVRDKLRARVERRRETRLVRESVRRIVAVRRQAPACRSILFVCTGNINRSAVAEERLQAWITKRSSGIQAASAGLLEPGGRPTSRLSREVAVRLGIDLSAHRSRVLTPALLEEADLVVAMDGKHLAAIADMSPSAQKKTILLGALDPLCASNDDPQIPDPYGKDRGTFGRVYERILSSVDALISLLETDPTSEGGRRREPQPDRTLGNSSASAPRTFSSGSLGRAQDRNASDTSLAGHMAAGAESA